MGLRIVRACVVVAVLAALAGPALGEEKKATSAKKSAPKLVLWAADDLKWIDPKGSPPGVKMAVLWGDPEKGAHGALHKFPGGFEAPLHHHTTSYRGVVISGTLVVTPEGGAPKSLPSGSYFSAPPMNKHVTKCEGASGCVILVDAAKAWDIVLEDKK